jgi:hypothetical protein
MSMYRPKDLLPRAARRTYSTVEYSTTCEPCAFGDRNRMQEDPLFRLHAARLGPGTTHRAHKPGRDVGRKILRLSFWLSMQCFCGDMQAIVSQKSGVQHASEGILLSKKGRK